MPRLTSELARLAALGLWLWLSLSASAGPWQGRLVRAALLHGVREVGRPGVPSALCVAGSSASVVLTGRNGERDVPVVAAAACGEGRAVVFGHDGFLDPALIRTHDTGRLVSNTLVWAGKGAPTGRVLAIGPHRVVEALSSIGVAADRRDTAAALRGSELAGRRIVVADALGLDIGAVSALSDFVARGGGLVVTGTAWAWRQYVRPGADFQAEFPGNRLMGPFGIYFTETYVEGHRADRFRISDTRPIDAHVLAALHRLGSMADPPAVGSSERELLQAAFVLREASSVADPGAPSWWPGLDDLARNVFDRTDRALARAGESLRPSRLDAELNRLAWIARTRNPRRMQEPALSCEDFPGQVRPDAKKVTREITLNPGGPGWRSTGCYAKPGTPVRAWVFPPESARGLSLRIGCHSDGLWESDHWTRWPEVSLSRPFRDGKGEVTNPFGGLVYVEVGEQAAGRSARVTIEGGVEAPFFEVGRTTRAQWAAMRSDTGAPWAELAARSVILTVPTAVVLHLDDPEPVLAFWDDVIACQLKLAGTTLARPERFVADEQISVGYLHAGYPIMSHLDLAPLVVDVKRLSQEGSWGHFHELGHNRQAPEWTFDGSGEVTCNIFTLRAMDKVVGKGVLDHQGVTDGIAKAREYLSGTGGFELWKQDPFLALAMYVQLQREFGWEAFRKVFAEYSRLAPGERPSADQDRRDQWMVRFSRLVRRDLGPFFRMWKVPVSERAVSSVAGFPPFDPGPP